MIPKLVLDISGSPRIKYNVDFIFITDFDTGNSHYPIMVAVVLSPLRRKHALADSFVVDFIEAIHKLSATRIHGQQLVKRSKVSMIASLTSHRSSLSKMSTAPDDISTSKEEISVGKIGSDRADWLRLGLHCALFSSYSPHVCGLRDCSEYFESEKLELFDEPRE